MILNLNAVSFQGFGTVDPERQSGKKVEKDALTITLNQDEAMIYRARSHTWVNRSRGMTALSVSHDGKRFRHYYLDKPVQIRQDVYYCLSALEGSSVVELMTEKNAERIGPVKMDSLLMRHSLRVEYINTFFYQEKEPGFLFAGEAHPMLELTYVDQGSMHSVVDGKDLLLEQGDMVVYGANQWHMQYADIGVAPRFVTISFDIQGGDLTSLYNRKFKATPSAVTLLQRMLQEQETMDAFSSDMILAQMNLLLLTLLREQAKPRGVKLRTSNGMHNENAIIRQAQQYISTHIREKLSVPMVAQQVDVSPSYLTALFHKNLQISPGEYIRRIKLQESKQMIRENNLNFTEIAAELQYSTVHHFSRQFKEKFGITPTEYAKSVR